MSTLTAAQCATKLIECYATGDLDGALALYDDNVHITVEFGLPKAVDHHGRDTIGKPMLAARAARGGKPSRTYADITVNDLVVHETSNPNVAITEWTYLSRIGDQVVENRNIVVVECRDGKIIRSRDYHNHVTRAVSEGTIPQLIEVLRGMILPQDAK